MSIIYDYNFSVFYNEDEISYYLLGAFITDGCVYKNNKNTYACQLSSCDIDWLESIKIIIGTNLKIHKFKDKYYGIRIIRNEIAQWFISHGCFPNKTYSIELPTIPDKYFRDFLRGCIDGDGSIGIYTSNNKIQRQCRLISASKLFLNQIQHKLNCNNINSSITNRGKQNNILNGKIIKATVDSYSLNFSGTNCYKLLSYIYYDNHKLSLNRKKNLADNIINYYNSLSKTNFRKPSEVDKHCKIIWPENNNLIEMINNSNIEKISKILGVSGSAIRNRLKKRKLYDKVIKGQKVAIPAKNEIIELLKEYSVLSLSKKLNIGYKTLRLKIKKMNIS
ncbi:Homing endonuclease, LAGLIDADG [uncultured Caudovirales phage]|uniref:Homing endonuclease, LAGLIDADG n=1 Tax=uncultured Caudovirales phage TaxID=2100421 RepID=A0A6J5RRD5_9CAUD|nr:Homing endonuclease, LAGLIDADG [uncultured Caudovirales phage]